MGCEDSRMKRYNGEYTTTLVASKPVSIQVAAPICHALCLHQESMPREEMSME
jgi:hypothetical protein